MNVNATGHCHIENGCQCYDIEFIKKFNVNATGHCHIKKLFHFISKEQGWHWIYKRYGVSQNMLLYHKTKLIITKTTTTKERLIVFQHIYSKSPELPPWFSYVENTVIIYDKSYSVFLYDLILFIIIIFN